MSTAHWIISASMIADYIPLDNEIPPSSFLNFTFHFNPQRQPKVLEDHTTLSLSRISALKLRHLLHRLL